jgi:hypothetical protein
MIPHARGGCGWIQRGGRWRCDAARMPTIEWPFRAAEALAAGTLTPRELRRYYESVYPGVWAPKEEVLTATQRARAAWLWSRRDGVLCGLSASALLGANWIEPGNPAELIHSNRRRPSEMVIHSDTLLKGETRVVDGMKVTAPARTAFDLGKHLPVDEAVQRIDSLMNATGVNVDAVAAVAARHPGVRGLRRLRETLALVDGGAESPYETKTRLLLVGAGFPPLQTQIPVRDEFGRVFARIDMGWPEYRVGVEFDGAHHWDDPKQRSWDIDRFAKLSDRDWIDVRLTSGILHNRPQSFLDRAAAALISRGCRKPW